jgi:ABC-type Fe3+/spermidine/putrescine transport system ATPase subunit
MNPVLQVTAVSQSFNRSTVLNDVSFSLDPGERLAIIGSSGSGKTTLLRLIAGLEAPTAGEITINGRCVSRAGGIMVAPEHREVALVFQGLALFPHLRALEQIAFSARGRGGVEAAMALLDRIGLGHRGNARLDELSGGERQRIALARAMAQQPRLILMDEPFSSLDDEKRAEMRDLLRSLLDSTRTTLILVTHSRDDALDLAHRTLVLEHGRPVAQASLESILQNPRHPAVVRAFGLGQVIDATATGNGEAQTPFGTISIAPGITGPVRVLIRPAQARIVTHGEGVEAEVLRIDLRAPESGQPNRIAIVRVGGQLLRVFAREATPAPASHVRVRIEGPCDVIDGT